MVLTLTAATSALMAILEGFLAIRRDIFLKVDVHLNCVEIST